MKTENAARPRCSYDRLPEHMREGMRLYIEQGIPPARFGIAVLSNDLVGSASSADWRNRHHLHAWAMWLYNDAPSQAWGSIETVRAYLRSFREDSAGEGEVT